MGVPCATSSCSSIQVCPCGTNTALKPASSAGLMSDFGLLPIIHVTDFRSLHTSLQEPICARIFLGDDSTASKYFFRPSVQFCRTVRQVTLGHQDQVMPFACRYCKVLSNVSNLLDWMLGNRLGKSMDSFVKRWRNRFDRKPFERSTSDCAKLCDPVAVDQ